MNSRIFHSFTANYSTEIMRVSGKFNGNEENGVLSLAFFPHFAHIMIFKATAIPFNCNETLQIIQRYVPIISWCS